MERQIIFRHLNPSENVTGVLDTYLDRHLVKFERFFKPSGPLHIEISRDTDRFICRCWGHFGRHDVVVHKDDSSIVAAAVGAVKKLEHVLRRDHEKMVDYRRHPRQSGRETQEQPLEQTIQE